MFVTDIVATAYEHALRQVGRGDLIELGSGRVPLYEVYRSSVASVTCLDWPSSGHDARHVDIEASLDEPLPLATSMFDTVVMTDVLEHLLHPRRALSESHRILRDGGHLVLGVPFLYQLHEEPHDYHRYTEHALIAMLSDAGYSAIDIESYGGGLEVMADLMLKRLATGHRSARLLVAISHGLRAMYRKHHRPSGKSPQGYVVVARR